MHALLRLGGFGFTPFALAALSAYAANCAPSSTRNLENERKALPSLVRACHGVKYKDSSFFRVGDLLCIYGPIVDPGRPSFSLKNADEIAALLAAFENGEIKWIITHSGGGRFDDAIRFGEAILGKDITIVVDGLCASACANYIFLPAAHKIVLQNSLVMWHGAPTGLKAFASIPGRGGERSDRLLRRAGVDPRLLIAPQIDTGGKKLDWRTAGWTYNPETLEKSFKVKGIVSMWYEPEKITALFPHLKIFFPPAP